MKGMLNRNFKGNNIDILFELLNKPLLGKWAPEKMMIDICEYILDGYLFVVIEEFIYDDDLKFDIDDFNWDMIPSKASFSFQLYLQGFLPIKYLIRGYNLNSKLEYLDLSAKFIESWFEYEPESNNEFTWYDHSTADRVVVMIYFILTVQKNNIKGYSQLIDQINGSIKKHVEFLYDDANYLPNNHGTMMNRSLYLSSIYLDDENSKKYREKALDRLRKELKRNYSENMVYLENSIFYHIYTLDLFYTLEKYVLNPNGDSAGDLMSQSSIEKSIDFLIQSSKPDLDYPPLGDSEKTTILKKKSFYKTEKPYPPLNWLLTGGKSGHPPKELFKIYAKEGYSFFRNSWDMSNPDKIKYVSFKSGFLFDVHKHADDLSFTMFAGGKDIFVDSGNFSYEPGEFRYYFISAMAHNTILVDDGGYQIKNRNNAKTGIIDFGTGENYSYVVGKNDLFNGVNITRSLYYLTTGDIVIVDNIQSKDVHKFSQYYHLGSDVNLKNTIVESRDNNTIVKITDDDVEIEIYQMGNCDIEFIKGDKNKAGPGVISGKYLELLETTSLTFSKKSQNTRFITLIRVDKTIEENIELKILDDVSETYLTIEGFETPIKIPLKEYPREISEFFSVEQNDSNTYTFTVRDALEDETFAWYIMRDGKRFDMVWYNSNPVLKYTFKESGDYQIRYFTQKGEDRKMFILPQHIKIKQGTS